MHQQEHANAAAALLRVRRARTEAGAHRLLALGRAGAQEGTTQQADGRRLGDGAAHAALAAHRVAVQRVEPQRQRAQPNRAAVRELGGHSALTGEPREQLPSGVLGHAAAAEHGTHVGQGLSAGLEGAYDAGDLFPSVKASCNGIRPHTHGRARSRTVNAHPRHPICMPHAPKPDSQPERSEATARSPSNASERKSPPSRSTSTSDTDSNVPSSLP